MLLVILIMHGKKGLYGIFLYHRLLLEVILIPRILKWQLAVSVTQFSSIFSYTSLSFHKGIVSLIARVFFTCRIWLCMLHSKYHQENR